MKSRLEAEHEFVDAIAEQVASCVDEAVERWIAEFDSVLQDPHLTTLGRLHAMSAIIARYRQLRSHTECAQQTRPQAAGWGIC